MKVCGKCGVPMRKYGDVWFCPDCDPKPWEMEEKKDKDEKPSYIG